MAQKDLHSITKKIVAIDFDMIVADGITPGAVIDTTFFNSFEFILGVGLIAPAAFTLKLILQHSDTTVLMDFVNVPDEFILGIAADAILTKADENSTVSLGYIGNKRFIRATVLSANSMAGTGTNAAGAIMVSDNARHIPFIPEPT